MPNRIPKHETHPAMDRMQALTREETSRIHATTMDLLRNTGVIFQENQGLKAFKAHGFKVDGQRVFFTEDQVMAAAESAPSRFTVTARNPEKSLMVGEDALVFIPGCGAPFIALPDGGRRRAKMQDYDNLCKLIQTSEVIDMNGFMMVTPWDVAPKTGHLDMMFSNIVLCDKPFMGSPVSRQAVRDDVEMAAIVWGGMENLKAVGPVSISLVNAESPLRYTQESVGALIELASAGQACVLCSQVMVDPARPMSLGGVLTLQNAEILAGVTLTQLIRPGAPVVYGAVYPATEIREVEFSIRCPELSMLVSATAQMARFYHLPNCGGGGMTNAHVTDAQAGFESMMTLFTAVRNGIHLILHSAGMMGSYFAMNYEKFLLDEAACGMMRSLVTGMNLPQKAIKMELIAAGTYRTFQNDGVSTDLMNRLPYAAWKANGARRIEQVAFDRISQRMAAYQKPEIAPEVEEALVRYVNQRKND